MEINSNLVHTSLIESTKEITWRDIMMYATAISDQNPYYFDDERKNGIFAHPMFPVSLTLPIVENLADNIREDPENKFPFEVLMTVVHYSEHLKIHRLIRPNDSLTVTGRLEAIIPHRAGTHNIMCFRGVDQQQRPVFTEYLGGMLRGVECVGGSQGSENIPIVPALKSTDPPFWEEELFVNPLQAHIYDGCVGPNLPFHTSKEIAHQLGLPNIILQGVCTLALTVSEIMERELEGDPTRVSEIACKFTSMVTPNSKINIRITNKVKTKEGQEIFFEVINDHNKKAIRDGYLKTT